MYQIVSQVQSPMGTVPAAQSEVKRAQAVCASHVIDSTNGVLYQGKDSAQAWEDSPDMLE